MSLIVLLCTTSINLPLFLRIWGFGDLLIIWADFMDITDHLFSSSSSFISTKNPNNCHMLEHFTLQRLGLHSTSREAGKLRVQQHFRAQNSRELNRRYTPQSFCRCSLLQVDKEKGRRNSIAPWIWMARIFFPTPVLTVPQAVCYWMQMILLLPRQVTRSTSRHCLVTSEMREQKTK